MYGGTSFLKPDSILKALQVAQPGEIVADFGCGGGFFTIPLAKSVGTTGAVTAIDVLQPALVHIKNLAQTARLFNIKAIRGNLEAHQGSTLPDNSQDLVVVKNILFQSPKKSELLAEAFRVIKPGGKILVIDWHPRSWIAPKGSHILTQDEARQILKDLGLDVNLEFHPDPHHFGLLAEKPDNQSPKLKVQS